VTTDHRRVATVASEILKGLNLGYAASLDEHAFDEN
jgi:hypothetical protein